MLCTITRIWNLFPESGKSPVGFTTEKGILFFLLYLPHNFSVPYPVFRVHRLGSKERDREIMPHDPNKECVENMLTPPVCPITLEEMTDPVMDPEGHSYERSAIEAWLEKAKTSPVTRNPLRKNDLQPNYAILEMLPALKMMQELPQAILDVLAKSMESKPKEPGTSELTVLSLTGRKVVVTGLNLERDTVRDVKDHLIKELGISCDRQLLIYQGKSLKDEAATLSSYNIEHGKTLHLVVRLRGG